MKFFWILPLCLLQPMLCQAIENDAAIGRHWAKCAEQADIFYWLNNDAQKKDVLRKTKAKLYVYAISAAGQEAVDRERQNVRQKFEAGISPNKEATANHMTAFYKEAEIDAKKCIDLMQTHESKFKDKVRTMIQRKTQAK